MMSSGLRYEAALAGALIQGITPGNLSQLRTNLKSRLLKAVAKLERGAARSALSSALAGLEAEQVLNVARQAAGDALIWSFPFPDMDGWTTARLAMHGTSPGEAEPGQGPGHGADETRLSLGISFSQLGPIRVEFKMSVPNDEEPKPRVVAMRHAKDG
jgi:hypothetical protein